MDIQEILCNICASDDVITYSSVVCVVTMVTKCLLVTRRRTLFYWSKSKYFAQITNWDVRLVNLSPDCIVLTLKTTS